MDEPILSQAGRGKLQFASLKVKFALTIGLVIALGVCALAIVGIVSLAKNPSNPGSAQVEQEPIVREIEGGELLSPLAPVLQSFPLNDSYVSDTEATAEAQSCNCPRVFQHPYEQVLQHHTGGVCVGGCNGQAFFGHSYGELVRTITIHHGGNVPNDGFTAIQIEMTDGVTFVFGSNLGGRNVHRNSFTFQPGEYIVGNLLMGTNAARRAHHVFTGYLEFQTSMGRSFRAGVNRNNLLFFPVNGRFLTGVFGRAGGFIDNLGFIFMRPIRSTRMVNVQYPTLAFLTAPNSPRRLARSSFMNDAPNDLTQTIMYSRTVGSSNCWTSTRSRMFGGSISVQAGFLFVRVTTEFRWEVSSVTTQSDCHNHTTTESSSTVVVVPARHRCEIEITQMVNHVDRLPFTADLEMTFNDGSTAIMRTSGFYTTVSVSEESVERRCSPL